MHLNMPTNFLIVETIAEEANRNLFKSISQCPSHVLRHLLIDKPTSSRSLRVRAHNLTKDNRNFLSRNPSHLNIFWQNLTWNKRIDSKTC